MKPSNDLLAAALEQEIARLSSDGWEVISRTATTAQMRQRARGPGCGVLGFILLSLAAGFLIHSVFYLLALLGLVVAVIAYGLRRDRVRVVSGQDLIDRVLAAPPSAARR